jgi:hypothetical protein
MKIQKLQILGAFSKKFKSRTMHTLKYLDSHEVIKVPSGLLVLETSNSSLQHLLYFIDDLSDLIKYLSDNKRKELHLSLGLVSLMM